MQLCRQKAFFLFYLGKSGYTGIHSLDNEHFPIKAPHSKKYGKFAQYYVKEINIIVVKIVIAKQQKTCKKIPPLLTLLLLIVQNILKFPHSTEM